MWEIPCLLYLDKQNIVFWVTEFQPGKQKQFDKDLGNKNFFLTYKYAA